jgi:YD repeat-containing protein
MAVVLFSCQKEADFSGSGNGGSGGGGGSTKLSRIVNKLGTDSFAINFLYNANGKVIKIFQDGSISGFDFSDTLTITRNSAGIVTSLFYINPEAPPAGYQELSTLNYNGTTGRYNFALVNGGNYIDSTAYTYDGSGKIIKAETFTRQIPGGTIQQENKHEYTYASAGGNVITEKYFVFDNAISAYEEMDRVTSTHDTKVNPLILGNESILFGYADFTGSNNANYTKQEFLSPPSSPFEQTITYTYNAAGNPLTGVSNLGITSKYYYK